MNLGVMGTYLGRQQIAPLAIRSIHDQLDRLIVILNEFGEVPSHFPRDANIEYRLPEHDLKDVAKFAATAPDNAYVFTLDDDIDYPPDYVRLMREHDRRLGIANAVVGLHGTVYLPDQADLYATRKTTTFYGKMRTYKLVDQLGTGLMMLRAEAMPSCDFMESAQRFVDIRFAAHAARNTMPLVVAPHPEHWARQLPTEVSIYQDFTQNLPDLAREEIASFAGVSESYGAARARVASLNRYAAKLVYARLRFGMAWRGLRRP